MRVHAPPGTSVPQDGGLVTFCNPDGAIVGVLRGGWMEKRLNFEAHHLHKVGGGGWAMEKLHLKQMQALGAQGMRVYCDDGRICEATLDAWLTHGCTVAGLWAGQVLLHDRFWRVRDGRQGLLL